MRNVPTMFLLAALAWMPGAIAAETPIPGVLVAQSEQTVTGCLAKGSDTAYALQTADGETIAVTGPPELAKHIDHTVQLKGTLDRSTNTFRATAVESLASSCGR